MIVERLRLKRELYVSIVMDRASQGPLLIGSPMGGSRTDGSSIVDVARSNPNLIFTEQIDIFDGLEVDQCERMAENIGLDPGTKAFDQTVDMMTKLYEMFTNCDCTLIEINPLAETYDGEIVCVDAKVQFDDNASFRQEQIFEKRDYDQEDPREVEAMKHGINYIGLDGSIGCMVNGAGLAMSTMDLIHAKGGSPANFLDVGGGANEQQVQKAFEILDADPHVKVVLVNIFGGLMRCDVIANGIINAANKIGIRTPLVIRLQGTNYEEAKTLIEECGYEHIMLADDLDDAATKAVSVADMIIPDDNDIFDDDDPLAISAVTNDGAVVVEGVAKIVPDRVPSNTRRVIPKFEGFSL